MEKEGLLRSLKVVKEKKFNIATLVTDWHQQIAKWLRENEGDITHLYDIWHLAKYKEFDLNIKVITYFMFSMQH